MSKLPQEGRWAKARKGTLAIEFGSACPGLPILAMISDGKHQSDYWLSPIPSAWGVACQLAKMWDGRERDFSSEVHEVCLDLDNAVHECDCLGFNRYGYCRHVDAAIKAFDEGLLKPSPRSEHSRRTAGQAGGGLHRGIL
jgi:hypothetical protein